MFNVFYVEGIGSEDTEQIFSICHRCKDYCSQNKCFLEMFYCTIVFEMRCTVAYYEKRMKRAVSLFLADFLSLLCFSNVPISVLEAPISVRTFLINGENASGQAIVFLGNTRFCAPICLSVSGEWHTGNVEILVAFKHLFNNCC